MDYTKKRQKYRLPLTLVGSALIITGSTLAFTWSSDSGSAAARPVKLVVDNSPIERGQQLTTSFAPVVKEVAPSVVQVSVKAAAKNVRFEGLPFDGSPFSDDPFFKRFFGDRFDREDLDRQFRRRMPSPERRGIGSGVIVTADGYILTNNHVVDGAEKVTVTLTPSGDEYEATVVGKDPKTDIAVLKIDAEDLPFLPVADSDQIQVGDLVLAVGNPFGIGQTVTMGMVSATGRGNVGVGEYEDFIQTDAAINPGNSGGALVDVEGRLVGINTAILSRTGGNQGIGFAVPANMARDVMENLVKHGRVVRGFLGVTIQDLSPELTEAFGLKQSQGALVAEVTPKSPAEKAGIKSGDVITAFNGEAIRDSRHLKLEVGQADPKAKVSVTVVRNGNEKQLDVRLKELEGQELASAKPSEASADETALRGVQVTDLNARARQQFQLPEDLKGALVTQVAPDSAAFEAGLRSGDVILEIDHKSVADAEEAIAAAEKLEPGIVVLRVWSRGASRYLAVDERDLS